MANDLLLFYEPQRLRSHLEFLLKDFPKHADLIAQDTGERSIHFYEGEEFVDLDAFVAINFFKEANKILIAITDEIDRDNSNPNNEQLLKRNIAEILAIADNLKRMYFLKPYPFIPNQLEKVVKKLTDFYLKGEKMFTPTVTAERQSLAFNQLKWNGGFDLLHHLFTQLSTQAFQSSKGPNLIANSNQVKSFVSSAFLVDHNPKDIVEETQKMIWTSGVAALSTMFYELATTSFSGNVGPYLSATTTQIKKFIRQNFLDIDGNDFEDSSLSTYLSNRADKKKAKAYRIPLREIFANYGGK